MFSRSVSVCSIIVQFSSLAAGPGQGRVDGQVAAARRHLRVPRHAPQPAGPNDNDNNIDNDNDYDDTNNNNDHNT